MGKVKRLGLWWQLYRTSLPVWDLENFRPMDFCWHECTTLEMNKFSSSPNSMQQKLMENQSKFPYLYIHRWFIYRIHNNQPPICVLSQMNPVYSIPSNLKLQVEVNLPSTTRSFHCFLSSKFAWQNILGPVSYSFYNDPPNNWRGVRSMTSLLCAIKLKCLSVCGNSSCCVSILRKRVLRRSVFLIVLC